jgi:hypothetical protein
LNINEPENDSDFVEIIVNSASAVDGDDVALVRDLLVGDDVIEGWRGCRLGNDSA